jgi:hypothetical protein
MTNHQALVQACEQFILAVTMVATPRVRGDWTSKSLDDYRAHVRHNIAEGGWSHPYRSIANTIGKKLAIDYIAAVRYARHQLTEENSLIESASQAVCKVAPRRNGKFIEQSYCQHQCVYVTLEEVGETLTSKKDQPYYYAANISTL